MNKKVVSGLIHTFPSQTTRQATEKTPLITGATVVHIRRSPSPTSPAPETPGNNPFEDSLQESVRYLSKWDTPYLGMALIIIGEIATVLGLAYLCLHLFSDPKQNTHTNNDIQLPQNLTDTAIDVDDSNKTTMILTCAMLFSIAHAIPLSQIISAPLALSIFYSVGSGFYGAVMGGLKMANKFTHPLLKVSGFIGGSIAGGFYTAPSAWAKSFTLNMTAVRSACGVFNCLTAIPCCLFYLFCSDPPPNRSYQSIV